MIQKINAYDDALPWQTHAYHLATRYKELSLMNQVIGAKLFYVEIAAGGRILPHSQKHAELLFCIEGTGSFSLNQADTPLRAGDMLQIPPNAVQGVVNQGDRLLRLLLIRAPEEARVELKEWLKMWWGR